MWLGNFRAIPEATSLTRGRCALINEWRSAMKSTPQAISERHYDTQRSEQQMPTCKLNWRGDQSQRSASRALSTASALQRFRPS